MARFTARLVAAAAQQRLTLRAGREAGLVLSAAYACRSVEAGTGAGAETVNEVMERADQALRLARRGGRPQVAGVDFPAFGVTARA